MTKIKLKYIANRQDVDISKEVLLRLGHKEVKKVKKHWELKKNRVKLWHKYAHEFYVKFYTKVDQYKILNINQVNVFANSDGSVRFHQITIVKKVENTWMSTRNNLPFYNAFYHTHFTDYNSTNLTYWQNKLDLAYSYKKILRKETTPYSTLNKYQIRVWKRLLALGLETRVKKITPIMETAYREKYLELLIRYGDVNAKKPITAFAQWFKSDEKEHCKNFLKMASKLNQSYFGIRTWKDYVTMCKNRNSTDFYNLDYDSIHTTWNDELREIKDKEIKRKEKELIDLINKGGCDVQVWKTKSKKELVEIGKRMAICVGNGGYSFKDIWIAKINKTIDVCIEYKNKKFLQIRGFRNQTIPKAVKKIIKKQILLKAN